MRSRDLEDLVELVGDEDDRGAALDERAHDGDELLGLLRSEDRRGLVEDEDVRLAIERLEDLDALPDADRQVLDDRVGIHLEAVALGDLDDPGPRGADGRASRRGPCVSSTPSMMFSVTVKTGTSMKC